MILHGVNGKWTENFISLDYDVDKVIRNLYDAQLNEHAPYCSMITEHLLHEGKVSHGKVLSRAMELCRKNSGNCIWPDIPEIYWKQAIDEIFG